MSTVAVEMKEDVAILKMNNGSTNAISSEFIEHLDKSIQEIKENAGAMLLTGNDKFFCIGINLPELIKFDRKEMAEYWFRFNKLTIDLYTMPMPTVSAICGHAIGGGCILALTTDFRYGTREKKQIGLNEINLGVPVPYVTDLIARQVMGDRAATDLIYNGKTMPIGEAKSWGLMDEVHDGSEVEDQAFKKAMDLAKLSGQAFKAIKSTRVEEIKLKYEANYKATNEVFLDCWFSDKVQKMLSKAAEKF